MILINLIEIIKKSAMDAVEESKPTDIIFGKVISINPLEIKIDSKLTLDANFLIKSSLVSDFDVNCEFDSKTSLEDAHTHDFIGVKVLSVKLGLTVGERVILNRVRGGQKFLIIDRVR